MAASPHCLSFCWSMWAGLCSEPVLVPRGVPQAHSLAFLYLLLTVLINKLLNFAEVHLSGSFVPLLVCGCAPSPSHLLLCPLRFSFCCDIRSPAFPSSLRALVTAIQVAAQRRVLPVRVEGGGTGILGWVGALGL